MTITGDRFLEGVKRRISMPASQVLFDDDDILAVANDVMRAYLVPILIAVRQDFFVTSSQTATVEDQDSYDIPYRAVGRGLRDLKLVDSADTTRDIALVPIEDEHRFSATTTTHSFYFKGDKIVLIPAPNTSGWYVEFWWEQPPAAITKTSDAALVTAINDDTVTCSSIPSTITTGTTVDFVKGKSGNATIDFDKATTNVSGTQISFGTDVVPSDLAVGDYIAVAETAPVLQLPNECHPLLETHTCRRILIALGDYDGAKMLDDAVSSEEKNLKLLLEPRIQGEPTVIMNRSGLLRGRRFMARRGLLF